MNKRLFLNWENLSSTRGLKELVFVGSEDDVHFVQNLGIRDVLGIGAGVNITRRHMRTIRNLTCEFTFEAEHPYNAKIWNTSICQRASAGELNG